MAEAMLRSQLAGRLADVRLASAGTFSQGRPATDTAVAVLADRGIDLRAHQSRYLSAELVGGADLVLGMARVHVRESAVLAPEAFGRVFTLKELVRRGGAIGPRRLDEPLEAWLARAVEGRRPADVMGDSPADDVADPVGQPRSVYERTADEIQGLLDALVGLVWGAELAAVAGSPSTDRT